MEYTIFLRKKYLDTEKSHVRTFAVQTWDVSVFCLSEMRQMQGEPGDDSGDGARRGVERRTQPGNRREKTRQL